MGINGFGRIGRLVTRKLLSDPSSATIRAINAGSAPTDYMAYQFKYDTVHGQFPGTVAVSATKPDTLVINGLEIPTFRDAYGGGDPAYPGLWYKSGVDYVLESSGKFVTHNAARAMIDIGGAKKVIITAPAKADKSDAVIPACGPNTQACGVKGANPPKAPIDTVVIGVNSGLYTGARDIVSCSSCTTNGAAPLLFAVDRAFGIRQGMLTTVHALTASQSVVDSSSKKEWRAGRSGVANIIPSSTGASKAIGLVLPHLMGKISGLSYRVPVTDVSIVDLTLQLERGATYEQICDVIKRDSEGDLTGILGYTEDAVVSSDFIGDERSCIFDAKAGVALNDNFVKLLGWYDNEWGYSCRVVDLLKLVAKVDREKKE